MNPRWKTSKTAVYNLGFHLIGCPKYRRNVLVDQIDKRLKELLFLKAKEIGVLIETIEIMPDHVRLFVKSTPNIAPQNLVQIFKGYSSRILREEFPHLKSRIPSLWTRFYFCESVGCISEETIKKYIESQKNK
jgi:putative transposase